MSESRLRKKLSGEFRRAGYFNTPIETRLEDGLPDFHAATPTGQELWLELKAVKRLPVPVSGRLPQRLLRKNQVRWLRDAWASGVSAFAFIHFTENHVGLMIPGRAAPWLNGALLDRALGIASVIRDEARSPSTFFDLAVALRKHL